MICDGDIVRRKVIVASRHTDYATETPYELFKNWDKYRAWLATRDDVDSFTAEEMDGYDAAILVEDNMFWGYKDTIRSSRDDADACKRLDEYYRSPGFVQHEKWLKWLGA